MKLVVPLLVLTIPGFATTIMFSTANPLNYDGTPTAGNTQTTNWNAVVSLPLFDPSLGTLIGVTLVLNGGVFGNVSLESLDAAPANVTYNLGSAITATGLGGLMVTVNPVSNGMEAFGPFDGAIDFGGTSGTQFLGLTDTDMDMATSNAPGVLANYIGLGNFNISLSAMATSTASGAGNLITQFQTQSGAGIEVIYEYDTGNTVVPEPASLLLMGVGLVGFALVRRGA